MEVDTNALRRVGVCVGVEHADEAEEARGRHMGSRDAILQLDYARMQMD